MFDAGEGSLDAFEPLVGCEQVHWGPLFKQCLRRGKPVRGLLLIAENGDCVGEYG